MSTKREGRKQLHNARSDFAVTLRLIQLRRSETEKQNRSYAGWSAADFAPDAAAEPADSNRD